MKKIILTSLLLFIFSAIMYAQASTPPEFPGGENAFRAFLAKNLKWPDKGADAQGIVTIGFTVEKDGQLTNIHVAKSLSSKFDNEALRVINLSPKWLPARQNNKFLKSNYSVPISFILKEVSAEELKELKVASPLHNAGVVIDEPIGNTDANDPPDKIQTSFEKLPEFPGGIVKFYDYVAENLKSEKITPADEGFVIVTFVAELDGSLTGLKIARGLSAKCDSLALKLFRNSPRWAPAEKSGRPVRALYSVPIKFKSNI